MAAQPIPVEKAAGRPVETLKPTITVALDDKYHSYVLKAAKDDDRSPSKWLKRLIQSTIDTELAQ